MEKMQIPITLVISGLFKSRIGRVGTISTIYSDLENFKKMNTKNQIIVSTYKGEFDKSFSKLVDDVVFCNDPGPDQYHYNPKFIRQSGTNQYVNFSRMAETSIQGLKSASNDYVIKSRLELIPQDFTKFPKWSTKQIKKMKNKNSIAFFYEFYSGIFFSIDGVLGNIPDIMQFARKQVLLQLWIDSLNFWNMNIKKLVQHRYPISSDQCLGLNYLSKNCNPSLLNNVTFLRRYTTNIKIIKAVQKAESELFVISSYKDSGFSVNYFKGSHAIKMIKLNPIRSNELVKYTLVLLLKRIKMFLKRYKRALKIKFLVKFHSN